jgi:enamine deaminase RidA (YjgF/YER057c/UK114 family)
MSPSQIEILNPEGHPPLAPTYSHISIAPVTPSTKIISFAGQVGIDSATGETAPSFREQVRLALANVEKCLTAAGVTKKDIISNRQYVVRMSQLSDEDRKARADLFLEWLGGLTPPPDTLIGVESLATNDLLIEIEVTAVKH